MAQTTSPDRPPILVTLDDRRRVSLGRIARHKRYMAREEPDGTIVMTPAEITTHPAQTPVERD